MSQNLRPTIAFATAMVALFSVEISSASEGEVADQESEATAASSDPGFDDDLFEDYDDLLLEDDEFVDSGGFPDPIEAANRKILGFNQVASKYMIGPVSRAYDFIMPRPAKLSIRRFFKNLNAPVTFANDMMQLEWKDAAVTTGAFVVNTTIGIGGLLEPAARIGMPRHRSDFGQTLALADVKSGPYLVIPLMGPTNLRDGTGALVDLVMRPASWFLGFGMLASLYTGGEAIVTLETHQRDLEELEKSSVDFYPALRSAYYQTRMGEVWNRREHRRSDLEPLESFPDSREDPRRNTPPSEALELHGASKKTDS
jgi:phospholipid-binding lipoprotein MlaA